MFDDDLDDFDMLKACKNCSKLIDLPDGSVAKNIIYCDPCKYDLIKELKLEIQYLYEEIEDTKLKLNQIISDKTLEIYAKKKEIEELEESLT